MSSQAKTNSKSSLPAKARIWAHHRQPRWSKVRLLLSRLQHQLRPRQCLPGARVSRPPGAERGGQHHGDRKDDPQVPHLSGNLPPKAGAQRAHADDSPPAATTFAFAHHSPRSPCTGSTPSQQWARIPGSSVNLVDPSPSCQQCHSFCTSG